MITLIDTSGWIEFFREKGDVETRQQISSLVRLGRAGWCEAVRLELWNGVRHAAEIYALEQMEPNVVLLSIDANVWRIAEGLARKARQTGRYFPVPDLLIAACARHHKAELLHKDAHFEQLKKLRV